MQRPLALQEVIQKSFKTLENNRGAEAWSSFRGSEKYVIFGMNEHNLIANLIRSKPSQQKFCFLDIGAGNCQWSKGLADFLNSQEDLPKNIAIKIISVCGEKIAEGILEHEVLGKCELYNIGSFAVENLIAEFEKRNFQIEKSVDCIVSRAAFCHFADPVGTFEQAYNLLRPDGGLMLMDGFFYIEGDESWTDYIQSNRKHLNMLYLLRLTGDPFLIRFTNDFKYPSNSFVLQRKNGTTLNLPLRYMDYVSADQALGSGVVTRFHELPIQQREDPLFYKDYQNEGGLYSRCFGDKELFDQLVSMAGTIEATGGWELKINEENLATGPVQWAPINN